MKQLTVFASLIILVFTIGCHSEHDSHHQEKITFKVTIPLKKDTTIIQEYVSQIHSISHIEIRSQERGFLQKCQCTANSSGVQL